MALCLLQILPRDVFRLILQHLSPETLITLDLAILNHYLRQGLYLPALHGLVLPYEIIVSPSQSHRFSHPHTSSYHQIHWLVHRQILVTQFVFYSSLQSCSCSLLIRHSHCVLKSLTLSSENSAVSLNECLLGLGHCPSLTSLTLTRCSSISEVTLTQFLLANSQLERLTLRDMNHLSQECGVAIAKCLNLRSISLPSNRWMSGGVVELLARGRLRLLTALDVTLTGVTDSDIHNLLASFPSLKHIAVEWYQLSNETLVLCWRQTVVRLLMSETLELQLVGLRNAFQILFYRREEIFEEENVKVGVLSRLIDFLRHPHHPLREEASRVLAGLPRTIINAEMVAPILGTAFEGDGSVKALCRDAILRICDTDLSAMIAPEPQLFSLFNAFFQDKRRRRQPTQQFARCVSYFVKNTREVPLLIDSRLLENFLALADSPDILHCVVDLIRHSVAQSSRELLSYLVEIGVLSYLLDILYVEPKDDELGDIFDVHAVNGLRELIKADERCRETLLAMDLPAQVVNILIQRESEATRRLN
jgi:hypothetical protein